MVTSPKTCSSPRSAGAGTCWSIPPSWQQGCAATERAGSRLRRPGAGREPIDQPPAARRDRQGAGAKPVGDHLRRAHRLLNLAERERVFEVVRQLKGRRGSPLHHAPPPGDFDLSDRTVAARRPPRRHTPDREPRQGVLSLRGLDAGPRALRGAAAGPPASVECCPAGSGPGRRGACERRLLRGASGRDFWPRRARRSGRTECGPRRLRALLSTWMVELDGTHFSPPVGAGCDPEGHRLRHRRSQGGGAVRRAIDPRKPHRRRAGPIRVAPPVALTGKRRIGAALESSRLADRGGGGLEAPGSSLSGGNQQKVTGKWLEGEAARAHPDG